MCVIKRYNIYYYGICSKISYNKVSVQIMVYANSVDPDQTAPSYANSVDPDQTAPEGAV